MTATTIRRLRYTPLRDLIVGQISGRLDLVGMLERVDLPQPIRDVIRLTVRKTRLWRLERVDVADELIAHFQDGLDAGTPSEKLVERFGDPRQAARLIRRARKRARPPVWRAIMLIGRCVAALMVLLIVAYLILAGRAFLSSPSVSVDYLKQLNAPVVALPADDRAWPEYRAALIELPPAPMIPYVRQPRPDEEGWQPIATYLRENKATLDRVRRAANLPGLGYVAGFTIDEADEPLFGPSHDRTDAGGLYGVLLPHLSKMRTIARILATDTQRAASEGDGDTAIANVDALLAMSEQSRRSLFLIEELVAASMSLMAYESARDAVTNWPDSFSDEQLARLAHVLASGPDFQPSTALEGERLAFLDIVQRTYTDDGNGNGHLTAEGVHLLRAYANAYDAELEGGGAALVPVISAVSADRREIIETYDRILSAILRELAKPNWQRLGDPAAVELQQLHDTYYERVRFFTITTFMPALYHAATNLERPTADREATLAAVALEIHRRRHGGYPSSLDALSPELLPRVPIDRWTGDRLIYDVVDGRPHLRSLGRDKVDDSGSRLRDEVYLPIDVRPQLPDDRPSPAWSVGPWKD